MEPGLSSEWQDLRGRTRADEEENTVHYRVFLLPPATDATPLQLNARLDAYRQLLHDIRAFVAQATEGYIWHVDTFHLSLECLASSGLLCLQGRVSFAENVEDEWLVVWLLRSISSKWSNTACTVVDNDGEFLLIEAAQALPPWVDPQSTAYRVYICQGHLCLIPPEVLPYSTASIRSALKALATDLAACICSKVLQDSVWKRRVDEQPARALKLNKYITRCVLPERCARVLHAAPWMVAPIVRAYLYRDEEDLKKLRNMANMDLTTANFVQRKVSFTRCTYAQMSFSSLPPTRPFRAAIRGPFAESMAALMKSLEEGEEEEIRAVGLSKESHAILLGWKLCVGLELLLSSDKWAKDRTPSQAKESTLKRAMVAATKLKEHRSVVEQYLSYCLLHPSVLLDGRPTQSLREEAMSLWRGVGTDESALEEDGVETMEEPDDSWMKVDASQVDRLVASSEGERLEEVFSDITGFLHTETEGDQDGAGAEERVGFDVDKFMAIFESGSIGLDEGGKGEEHDNLKPEHNTEMGFFEAVELMDEELQQQQAIGSSVTRIEPTADHPLDINFTVVNNLIESLESQEGNPGPASNLLGEISGKASTSGD